MPDLNDGPAPDSKSPGENPAKATGEGSDKAGTPPPAEPLSLVPRTRAAAQSAREAAAAPPSNPEVPPGMADFMNWIKALSATTQAPAAPPAPAAQAPLTKERRKFERVDRPGGDRSEPPAPAAKKPEDAPAPTLKKPEGASAPAARKQDDTPLAAPLVEKTGAVAADPSFEDDADEKGPVSKPVHMPLTGGTSGRRQKAGAPGERRTYFWLFMQLGAILLLGFAFYLGRTSVSKEAAVVRDAAPAAPGTANEDGGADVLSPEATKLIDEAMAAEQDRKFEKATQILERVQREFPRVRDIDFRLALLALEREDPAKALPLLNLAIKENEQAATAYKLRATVLSRRGGINRAMNDFENSTKVDPFNADNFFFWGEALRRAGKPQAAAVRLQQAIDRLREPALENLYRLKLRLTQIDLGQEAAFAEELAKKLADTPAESEWLFTAAALEMSRRNFTGAADFLDKARIVTDRETYMMRLRDYYFFNYRYEAPLKRFFAFASPPPPAATGSPAPGGEPVAIPVEAADPMALAPSAGASAPPALGAPAAPAASASPAAP